MKADKRWIRPTTTKKKEAYNKKGTKRSPLDVKGGQNVLASQFLCRYFAEREILHNFRPSTEI